MLWITILISVIVSAVHSALCPNTEDPCYRYNGLIEIPDMDTRHPSIKIGTVAYSQDVYKLRFGLWYISDFPLTSAAVENGHCGTKFPIWVNGSTPTPGEGYVNLTACVKDYNDTCADTVTVLAKNCGYYYVYCFWNLPYADQRFCFDVDLSKVTTTTKTTTTATTTTTKQTATKAKTAEYYYHDPSKQSGDSKCDCSKSEGVAIGLGVTLALTFFIFVIICACRYTPKKNIVCGDVSSPKYMMQSVLVSNVPHAFVDSKNIPPVGTAMQNTTQPDTV
ncbi:hypothetical protein DPMN_115761 [Dreissena polymorpha]|uniref:Uncharacterized protein n=1 Tax=Dreissena polymorpha TaxID=45954 RepID=A0A9D4QSX8_DREPO|nr:hypothetical protein DPMN_115761 [Dreissena polymorpha]